MLESNRMSTHAPQLAKHWSMGDGTAAEVVRERAGIAAALPQRTVPDLCELLIVANSTGTMPDRPDLHAPISRIAEVPTLFSTKSEGGLLDGDRRIDVFNCLRRPDEVSFAGGVFVVVRCEDRAAWEILRHKGHVLNRTGSTAMLYLPRHVLGLEAATSILAAAVHGVST